MPNAWQSFAGPLKRSTLALGRAAPPASPRPSHGRQRASSTATPSPSAPHTALAHQCMP